MSSLREISLTLTSQRGGDSPRWHKKQRQDMNIEMLKGILFGLGMLLWFAVIGYSLGNEVRKYRERKRIEREDNNGMD